MENGTENERRGANNIFGRIRSILPGDRTALGERKPWYKIPLWRRIVYFTLSLLLAVFLWGFVLMSQNPDREKTFTDIQIHFESGAEADLIARKLAVYGNLNEILESVSVTVSAPLTDVSKMDSSNISATVSLSSIHEAGTYELEIKATSTVGTVKSVEPSTVEVEIDDLVSLTVPVSYQFTGELPEGYWHDTPSLLSTTATVEGAKNDIINVSNAVCSIDLTGLTKSVNSAYPLTLLDSNGNEVSKDVFKNMIPAVTVRMTVLPHKQVPILQPEIVDDELSTDIFEITEQYLTVEYLDIAAEQEVLDSLTELECEEVRITNVYDPVTKTFIVKFTNMPDGCTVLGGVDVSTIQFRVVITERIVEQIFVGLPITVFGEAEGYDYSFDFANADVRVTGPARLIQGLVSSDITVILNVRGKTAGEYDIELEYTITDFDLFANLQIEFMRLIVHVTVTESQAP